jgi:hypothetical protein
MDKRPSPLVERKRNVVGNPNHVGMPNENKDALASSLDLEEWSNDENRCSTTGNAQRNTKQHVTLLQLSQRATALPNERRDALASSSVLKGSSNDDCRHLMTENVSKREAAYDTLPQWF